MSDTRIVILGGGFAGGTLAASLEKRLPDDCRLSLVSKENHITYNPLLAEVVGASILPGHVVAPLRQLVRKTRICMVPVSEIDLEQRQLHYLGEGTGVISYDHLVLACGVNANLKLVPGMASYARVIGSTLTAPAVAATAVQTDSATADCLKTLILFLLLIADRLARSAFHTAELASVENIRERVASL